MKLILTIKKMGLASLLTPFFCFAQPANDAGIGRFGSFGDEVVATTKKQPLHISIGSFYSTGKSRVSYVTPYARIKGRISDEVSLSIELAGNVINQKDFGQVSGLGDALVAVQYHIPTRLKADFVINSGFRLATGNGNNNGFLSAPQPLFMQTSLGSNDFLMSFSFKYNGLLAGIGLQLPLTASNNRFESQTFTETDFRFGLTSSRFLKRGADLALFFKKEFEISPKLSIQIGATPLLRLGRSEYFNEEGIYEEVLGSNGLTFNAFSVVTYTTKNWIFSLEGGVPLATIDANLDGLHRYFYTGARVTKIFSKKKPKRSEVEESL